MTFLWSPHAAALVSIFPPWHAGDGWTLDILDAAEQALGIALPSMLRNFYHAWGWRADLTRARQTLYGPDTLTVEDGWLIFAGENQGVYSWAISVMQGSLANPAVYYADVSGEASLRQWQLSHAHLSDLLDYLVAGHALSAGAPVGGMVAGRCSAALVNAIGQHYPPIEIASVPMGLFPDPTWRWQVHGGDGVLLDCLDGLWVAARRVELREAVRQRLGLTWTSVW